MSNWSKIHTVGTMAVMTIPTYVGFRDCVGYISRVKGISMQNAINPGKTEDWVFISRFNTFKPMKINHGDVVCFISPVNSEMTMIKRVVGLEGDTVRAVNYNKKRVKQEYNKIPVGHCWVEGDNREHSRDSNDFGPIPLGLLTGKTTYIIWPPGRWRRLETKETCPERVIKRMSVDRLLLWDHCE